jgi:hypothetical protein
MIKLIDYGRTFTTVSSQIFNEIDDALYKNIKICGSDHGTNRGFFLSKFERKALFIDYNDINLSHDLRLLEHIRTLNRINRSESPDIAHVFNILQYNVGINKNSQYYGYGTSPNLQRGYLNSINNIFDVPDIFWEYLNKNQIIPPEDKIKAIIDIYDDLKTPLNIKIL